MAHHLTRRRLVTGLGGVAGTMAFPGLFAAETVASATPPTPAPMVDLAAELARWDVPEANQGVAVDRQHFYGIGNRVLVKHRKSDGKQVAKWEGMRDGAIIHYNAGYVEGTRLVLAHSNFPQLPMASSLETYDTRSLQPIASQSLGIRLGSLTWAVRHRGHWWACFANYNDAGTTPGFDQRWTYMGQFDDRWQLLQSWLFPPQFVTTWGVSSCSCGDWGDDGLLYVTGHDAPELHALRLPRQGVTLEHVAVINVPFEGQGWAWDRSAGNRRVIYGISRARRQVIVTRIPMIATSR
jgi:hypothetical protein